MAKQQCRFKKFSISGEHWSSWWPLDDNHYFQSDMEYQFRDTPTAKPLEDGLYARMDANGLPFGAVYRREDGEWRVAESGRWMKYDGMGVDDANMLANNYFRMVQES